MRQLTALDASFVYMETSRTPMHIGGMYLLDASQVDQTFGYDQFRSLIESRLSLARIFRQRMLEVPLGLGHPFWIEDPDFDLDLHLPRIGAPRPGGKKELMRLASDILARPLNRSRPLWEMAFVDGVDEYPGLSQGSFAVISRVHHAAIDGASGAEIMGALADIGPVPRKVPTDHWQPEQVPNSLDLAKKSYSGFAGKPKEVLGLLSELISGTGQLLKSRKTRQELPPTLPMSAPRTRLNSIVTSQRNFGGVEFDLSQIKALRKLVPGSTVNDAILAVCSGALRRYLQHHQDLPEKSLIAMAPISVRSKEQKTDMGNQVSAMLVKLATDEPDPTKRLHDIHQNTISSKKYSSALPANRLIDLVPSELAGLAARLYTRMKVADRHKPFFNLIITNVPGPPIPLYIAGARVHSHFGMAPVFDGMGLILVVFSQAGKISVGINACKQILPDIELFEQMIEESLMELENSKPINEPIQSESSTKTSPRQSKRPVSIETLSQSLAELESRLSKKNRVKD